MPGRPESQPTWNHPYLFVEERDKATLFTPAAALVIEYYVASTGEWSINFSYLVSTSVLHVYKYVILIDLTKCNIMKTVVVISINFDFSKKGQFK